MHLKKTKKKQMQLSGERVWPWLTSWQRSRRFRTRQLTWVGGLGSSPSRTAWRSSWISAPGQWTYPARGQCLPRQGCRPLAEPPPLAEWMQTASGVQWEAPLVVVGAGYSSRTWRVPAGPGPPPAGVALPPSAASSSLLSSSSVPLWLSTTD